MRPTPVSIHAPREGCDHGRHCGCVSCACFNSRTPGGVRLTRGGYGRHHGTVSIHAPREGCDSSSTARWRFGSRFNSRTPGGVRHLADAEEGGIWVFQFTHPGRGATSSREIGCPPSVFQFTHPGRGATTSPTPHRGISCVSIHAPREGCDVQSSPRFFGLFEFQFTHPGRGATKSVCIILKGRVVSIHAPREGCDFILPLV